MHGVEYKIACCAIRLIKAKQPFFAFSFLIRGKHRSGDCTIALELELEFDAKLP